ncbi:MAG: hypothetical protein ACRD3Q_00380 [Terriglobales bacterium]
MATLVAQPNPYAAFAAGLTTEFAILGAVKPGPNLSIEELRSEPASLPRSALAVMRRHAVFLLGNA